MATLLIIEDDMDVARMYRRLFDFKKDTYKTEIAFRGKQGADRAKEIRPDLILLDIMMPVLDGLETLRLIREEPTTKDVPVIMLTNVGDEDTIKKAKALGANDYMVKSDFTPEQVLKKVDDYIK